MPTGAYPGSFDPPTVAHLAIAAAARDHFGLDRLDLVVSRVALGKETVRIPTLEERVAVLEEVAATRPWLGVRVSPAQLIAEVAAGYDALVVGADKWAQVVDEAWYDSPEARDAAIAGLPPVLVAPRPPFPIPRPDPPRLAVLALEEAHQVVSSTAARQGRSDWMLPEADRFDQRTGAWTDPARYVRERRVPGESGR